MIVSKLYIKLKKNIVMFLTTALVLGPGGGCWPLKNAPLHGGREGVGGAAKAAVVQRRSAELLREMMSVVLGERVFVQTLDRAAFGDWVDSLNQGMSLEGAYRGIVYGERYRQLEAAQMSASDTCRQMFDATLRAFSTAAMETAGVEHARGGALRGMGAYALKRELGEQAMGWVEKMSGRPGALEAWFGRFAVGAAEAAGRAGVDFGVGLRMRGDFEFHRAWAAGVLARGEKDRVVWEVLTRVHRLMNRGCGV
jgi:hypothetical protein